jgi:hypothetical protein
MNAKRMLVALPLILPLAACGAEGSDQVWESVKTIDIVALDGTTSLAGETGHRAYVLGHLDTTIDYVYATRGTDGSITQHLTSEMNGKQIGPDYDAHGNFVAYVDTSQIKVFQDATDETARIEVMSCHAKKAAEWQFDACAVDGSRLEIHVPSGSFDSTFEANAR